MSEEEEGAGKRDLDATNASNRKWQETNDEEVLDADIQFYCPKRTFFSSRILLQQQHCYSILPLLCEVCSSSRLDLLCFPVCPGKD